MMGSNAVPSGRRGRQLNRIGGRGCFVIASNGIKKFSNGKRALGTAAGKVSFLFIACTDEKGETSLQCFFFFITILDFAIL